jgi:cytochrome b561
MTSITHGPIAVTEPRYDLLQRILHWTMAAIILVAIAIGLYCWTQPPGTPTRVMLLEVHKSLGMTALVLIVVRLAWRLIKGAPAYTEKLSPLVHAGAHLAHWALYATMLWMPITGYIFSGAGGYSLPFFGLFQWPRLLPHDKALAHTGAYLHGLGAYLICGLLLLHLGAVAWHRLIKKDAILSRML